MVRWHDGNWDGDYGDGWDNVLYYTYDGNFNVTGLVDTAGDGSGALRLRRLRRPAGAGGRRLGRRGQRQRLRQRNPLLRLLPRRRIRPVLRAKPLLPPGAGKVDK